ncbi:hypothetical protein HFP15_29025 [Amycolatopsis sp. K13G38]|uniref:FAD-binding FR-type domain-containing protein n=1 Tax=Amycolatopsis acididurans TaxID=2724524 RepID=A0ABX1JAV7_9PSEU|nr:FAD-binding oxidoreductase [Amycolatopsis acididurans]NKQ56922.1 hypothetical protein [Amycolatopsis acididurans]
MRVPAVVAPTLLVFGGSLTLGGVATWLALAGLVSPVLTIPMHVAAVYGLFVVVHESVHHAAGRITWVNDLLGRIAMPFVSFVGAFPSARFLHLDRHRNDAEAHLTSWNVRGPRWQLPLRWALADIWYLCDYLRRGAARPQLEAAEALAMLAVVPGSLAALAGAGYGWQLVVVYLLPQRIAIAIASWWFDWFPRKQRPGARTYHRVHARYPSVPFHRYLQAWHAGQAPAGRMAVVRERPARFHELTVSAVRPLALGTVAIDFAVPERLRPEYAFAPGQYVVVRAAVNGEVLERTYAICSADALRIAVKQVPGGRFSTYAATRLMVGEKIEVLPRAGARVLDPGPREAKQYVAIVAGIGIAPVLPLLEHALATAPRCRATLLYINRSGADTLFATELTDLTRQFEGRLRIQHFRTDERDPDLRPPRPARPFDSIGTALAISYERYRAGGLDGRRLRTLLESRLHPAKVDQWLVSAPAELAEPLLTALGEHGVPAGAVHREEFTHAAGAPASGIA